MSRVLVAAFGNELRGDDGFGIAVLRALEALPLPAGVVLLEIGTGGLWLAQQLLTPCDRLVVIDAVDRGSEPGSVHVLRVEQVASADAVDMHLAVPAQALAVAKMLGALPPEMFVVGCQPETVDDLTMDLSACVRAAVPRAVREVQQLMQG